MANTVAIPTDCPQREKAGWTGDVSVYAPTMCFLRNEEAFLRSWLNNCRAEQEEGGEIPTVVPFLECYREMNRYYGTDTSCGWGDVIVIAPWCIYQAYGNRRVLEENYGAMKKWMQYVQHCAETERPKGYEASAYTTKEMVAPAYYAFSTELMSKIAHVLGGEEDAAYYAARNEKIRRAFMEEYVEEDGHIKSDMQGVYVLALKHRLVPEEIRPKVVERLLQKIAENGGCLDTGFLSVPFLMDVLTENGCRETAYQLLYQNKCPSWLYEVEMGATTMWESWGATSESGEVGKYSYNHYAYGCVGDWMYRELAGICAKEAGYRRAKIAPAYDCGLEYVKGALRTPYGDLKSAWQKKGDAVHLEVVVPANTRADVVLPDGRTVEVGSGIWKWSM